MFSNSDGIDCKTEAVQSIQNTGYITSLPSHDEMKVYKDEGMMSPHATLSEISALRSLNDGFQKPIALSSTAHNKLSEEVNGAIDAETNHPVKCEADGYNGSNTSNNDVTKDYDLNRGDLDDDMTDILDTSSDDDGLLSKVIQSAMPKKR